MFKAFLAPAQNLLESSEQQRYVIAATVFAGIIDISVAWYLIPAHGAVGACIGNGAAQLTAVGIMWAVAIYHYKVKLPWMQVAKIVFISALAALTAHLIAVRLPPVSAILCGGCAALIVLFGLFYLMRVLEPEDHDRFKLLAGMLPKPLTGQVDNILSVLTRPKPGGASSLTKYPLPGGTNGISPMIAKVYRKGLPMAVRQRIWSLRSSCKGVALRMKLEPIRVDACLRGGDNGVPAATFARMIGDIASV
jgi:hypothetical protein